ncbi:MAG: Uma2 family endonuclease [Anaerolineae bacterium]|nr:Uma2 family endonuclease [Anaerolineae bacterium]
MTAQERLYTADDLLNMNMDDHVKVELVEGVLVEMPPASIEHSILSSHIIFLIKVFLRDNHASGVVTGEQGGYKLGENPDTVRAPDVGYISQERLGLRKGPYFPGAPDLAVEVISPNDKAADVQEKIDEYLGHGSRLVWTVYHKTRVVVVHTPDGSHTLHENDTLDGGDVLPGFNLPVRDIFAALES